MISSDAKKNGAGNGRDLSADVCDDTVVLSYASGQLLPAESSAFQSHLEKCTACGESLLAATESLWRGRRGQSSSDAAPMVGEFVDERRRYRRVSLDEHVILRSLNPPSLKRVDARVTDSSKMGLGLAVGTAIDPGTMVQIRRTRQIAMAEVRYCRPSGAAFTIGVEIHDVFPIA